MKYVSLHSHSTFSYMDGYGTPKHHHERAAEIGMPALALTEHGNTSSHVQHEKASKVSGVKPIFGLEAYTARDDMREKQNQSKWHMIILAMNTNGYQNLNRLVSRSWAEGFYRWPTITPKILWDDSDDLIMTSGCADSLLSCTLLGGKNLGDKRDHYSLSNFENALKVVQFFQDRIGDRYYIEVQRFAKLERTRILNPAFAELSRITGVPLVATSDVHYPYPNENEMQKILHAAGRNTGTVAAAEASWEYDIRLTYPTSDREILGDLVGTGLTKRDAEASIVTTGEIADRCNVTLPKSETIKYPGAKEDLLPWE